MNQLLHILKDTDTTCDVFDWNEIVEMTVSAFRFTDDEKHRFATNRLAKLIAAIPFLAGCKDPKRTAISHIGTYILSVKLREVANARPSDDEYLFRRIELLGNVIGGDQEIVQRGMNLIALCMLADYIRDIRSDVSQSKYNPVVAGAIEGERVLQNIVQEIEAVPCPEMDRILTPAQARIRFWIF